MTTRRPAPREHYDDDDACVSIDVVPAPAGRTASLTLRAISDKGVEFDRLTLSVGGPEAV